MNRLLDANYLQHGRVAATRPLKQHVHAEQTGPRGTDSNSDSQMWQISMQVQLEAKSVRLSR